MERGFLFARLPHQWSICLFAYSPLATIGAIMDEVAAAALDCEQ
jgi:hypothetical protein